MCIKLSHDTPRFTQCYRLTISQSKKGKKKSQQIWGSMGAIVDKVCKGKAKKVSKNIRDHIGIYVYGRSGAFNVVCTIFLMM